VKRIIQLNIKVADVDHAVCHRRREDSRPGVLIAEVPARDRERPKADLHGVVHGVLPTERAQVSDVASDPGSGVDGKLDPVVRVPPRHKDTTDIPPYATRGEPDARLAGRFAA
jgi:hypothetical protein